MYLKIDPSNGNPIYLQIIEQIKHAISIGVFEIGKPIPTIREIALELRVNPNTVAKAVRELERDGVIKTYVGKGSFVTGNAQEIAKEGNDEKAVKLTGKFIRDISWLGFGKPETINLVDENWEKSFEEK